MPQCYAVQRLVLAPRTTLLVTRSPDAAQANVPRAHDLATAAHQPTSPRPPPPPPPHASRLGLTASGTACKGPPSRAVVVAAGPAAATTNRRSRWLRHGLLPKLRHVGFAAISAMHRRG
ncbi:hypothetical protein ACJQWK_10007 [Exserohilum turcicum]